MIYSGTILGILIGGDSALNQSFSQNQAKTYHPLANLDRQSE
ncbi:MAG: hypothetical protein AAB459_03410 [Patescibacteria group bacterium]